MPKWSNGSLMSDYDKWVPRPDSKPAKFLKVVELCGGCAPSSFFNDNAHLSNLGGNKAKYLTRLGKGCELTEKGKQYLATHEVQVHLVDWIVSHSKLRYAESREDIATIMEVANLVHKQDWDGLNTFIRSQKYHARIQW